MHLAASPRHRALQIAGATLVLLSLLGFLTVADDLRHVGELVGVGAILIAGLALLGAGFESVVSRRLALPWVAVGVLAGAAAGAPVDRMPLLASAGFLVGVGVAILRARSRN